MLISTFGQVLGLSLLVAAASFSFPSGKVFFKLRLLHTNDMHARFEQVSRSAGKCSDWEASRGLCYGGFARVLTALEEESFRARQENVSTLSLNAGDTYQGTVWYAMYKWQVVLHFLKMLAHQIDVMSLGNHEFDDGIKGLTPFLREIGIPIVASNIDMTEEPDLRNSSIRNSVIVKKAEQRIGVIGYLTPETVVLAETGKVKFFTEIESITKEAKLLKKSGVDIIIALGHSGFEMDVKIAKEVPDVDVVVGGHSHTFLYTGKPPDSEIAANQYPVLITQETGRKVAVVQAYAFTKYLGKLDLSFDEEGELVEAIGNPILLNSEVRENAKVLKELKDWRAKLNSTLRERLGETKVFLEGSDCRFYECNLGNLITDAYIHHVLESQDSGSLKVATKKSEKVKLLLQEVKNSSGPYWTNTAIAIQQSGGIRASINATSDNGILTREDIITSMPFFSALSVVSLRGKHLKEALEWSVARYDVSRQIGRGEFLQVSGLQVKYDLNKAPGSRVASVRVRCAECHVPALQPLEPEKQYNIIMPTFLFKGGDNYTIFKKQGTEINQLGTSDTEIVMRYVQERDLVYPGLEDRIDFVNVSSSNIFKPGFIYIFLLLYINIFK